MSGIIAEDKRSVEDKLLDRIQKFNIKMDDIVIMKGEDFRDAEALRACLDKYDYNNIILFLSPDITLETASEEKILRAAEMIKERRKK